MFETQRKKSKLHAAWAMTELMYHTTVHNIRGTHRSAFVSLFLSISTIVSLAAVFVGLQLVLGFSGGPVRGSYLLFILTGIFMYITHIKAVGAVASAGSSVSLMMQHAPMNTAVSIVASALAALYIQILAAGLILFLYHSLVEPVEIYQPVPAIGMFVTSWFTGCCVGMLFLALKPWFPSATGLIQMLYMRMQMIFSGKMVLANALPGFVLGFFEWNPLFHSIDQARGFAYVNYTPRYTSIGYPLYVGLTLLVIGMLGEFYTRKRESISWGAK